MPGTRLRSHGFFYKPDGERSGTLALPVREFGEGVLPADATSACYRFSA
ncbi:MAG: hypothetical protein AAF411_03105 [Myxococcota bacterium]